jgi:hypothetical protein
LTSFSHQLGFVSHYYNDVTRQENVTDGSRTSENTTKEQSLEPASPTFDGYRIGGPGQGVIKASGSLGQGSLPGLGSSSRQQKRAAPNGRRRGPPDVGNAIVRSRVHFPHSQSRRRVGKRWQKPRSRRNVSKGPGPRRTPARRRRTGLAPLGGDAGPPLPFEGGLQGTVSPQQGKGYDARYHQCQGSRQGY